MGDCAQSFRQREVNKVTLGCRFCCPSVSKRSVPHFSQGQLCAFLDVCAVCKGESHSRRGSFVAKQKSSTSQRASVGSRGMAARRH